MERDAVALASLAEDALEQRTSAPPALTRLARRYQSDTGGRVIVVDAQGRALVDSESQGVGADFSTRPEIAAALDGTVATGTRRTRDTLGTDLLYVAVPVASGGVVHGAARITYPTSEVDERVRRYWLILAAIAAVVLAVAVALAGGFARWIVRAAQPRRRRRRRASPAATSPCASRAAGPPELRRLAGSFNEMVAKLQALLHSQEQFVADASHQLRTPLTALRLRLENLAQDAEPQQSEELEGALDELERLGALVDGLLTLARADRAASAPGRARRRRRDRRARRGLVGARRGAAACSSRRARTAARTPSSPRAGSSRCSTTCSRTRSKSRPPAPASTSPPRARKAGSRSAS